MRWLLRGTNLRWWLTTSQPKFNRIWTTGCTFSKLCRRPAQGLTAVCIVLTLTSSEEQKADTAKTTPWNGIIPQQQQPERHVIKDMLGHGPEIGNCRTLCMLCTCNTHTSWDCTQTKQCHNTPEVYPIICLLYGGYQNIMMAREIRSSQNSSIRSRWLHSDCTATDCTATAQ